MAQHAPAAPVALGLVRTPDLDSRFDWTTLTTDDYRSVQVYPDFSRPAEFHESPLFQLGGVGGHQIHDVVNGVAFGAPAGWPWARYKPMTRLPVVPFPPAVMCLADYGEDPRASTGRPRTRRPTR